MASNQLDISKLTGEWLFQRPGRAGMRVTAAQARVEQQRLIVEVSGPRPMTMTVQPAGNVLRGTAKMAGPEPLEVEVELRLHSDGRIIATPERFANREQWALKRP